MLTEVEFVETERVGWLWSVVITGYYWLITHREKNKKSKWQSWADLDL